MEPVLVFLALRMAERITSVLVGALLVILGYRLFVNVPELQDAKGSLRLPKNVSVYLSNIGPGAFFALFGSVIIATSLIYGMSFQQGQWSEYGQPSNGTPVPAISVNGMGEKPAADSIPATATPTDREIRETVALIGNLNRIPSLLKNDLSQSSQVSLQDALRTAKQKLMSSTWDPAWGDKAAFAAWIDQGADPASDSATGVSQTAIGVFNSVEGGE